MGITDWKMMHCDSLGCEMVDTLQVARYQKATAPRDHWLADGWVIERPDDAHEDSWWQCPACLRGESW